MPQSPFGQFLVDRGVLTPDQLRLAGETSDAPDDGSDGEPDHRTVATVLIEQGLLTEDELLPHLSDYLGVPHIRLKGLEIDPAVIEAVPVRYAHFYRVIPIEIENGTLTLAMFDPQDIRKVDDLRSLLGRTIRPVLCGEGELDEALKRHYGIGAETVDRMVESDGGSRRSSSTRPPWRPTWRTWPRTPRSRGL
jgi:type IV pilus assembly protein PilB